MVASHCFIFVSHCYFVLFHQLKDEEDLVEESQDIMTFMTAKSQNLIDLEDNEVIEENEHLELQNSHSELGNVKERPGELDLDRSQRKSWYARKRAGDRCKR